MAAETRIIYHIDEEETPYLIKVPVPINQVTLADFKNALCRPNYKFFFKSYDDEFGEVKEEIVDDDANLPCVNGKVISWLVPSEGSNVSDSNSQCADSIATSDIRRPVGRPLPRGLRFLNKPLPPPDDTTTCTETESVISSRRGFNLPNQGHRSQRRDPNFRMDKYSRFDGLNGGKHRSHHHYESSIMSSDLETTTFLESDDDDASSRITATTDHTSVSRVKARQQQQRRQRRKKHRPHAMSRTSSFSSITDSSMSLNIINVVLNMNPDDNGPSFLGISIIGESNVKGGDGGIYVGSIMKGGAIAKDGRIEPGDMILQVNDTNFENMSNDEAVKFLRQVAQKPGPVKLVVAKCWDMNPKGSFTIPRTEPVRPIDPEAWVAHVAATGEYPPRPPSVTTMTSTGSSITSSLPETERRTVEETILQLSINTQMPLIVREMQKVDSGLEIRDRNWLKINIPNAFIGADVVDWLLNHVKGFVERKEARKFAAQMLKRGYIRHTVNKLTFSEQCYYIFGEIVPSMAALRIRDDDKEVEGLDACAHSLPSAPQGCWSNPYSSSTLTNGAPLYAPMPYMTGGYESNAYSYPQEKSLHSGSGGSSNDTTGSRRERQHLVRDNHHSHGVPQGFSAPLEMRAMDSDSSESNRSRKSGSSVLMQLPMHGHPHAHGSGMMGNLPPPSYANVMLSQGQGHRGNPDVTNNHNQNSYAGPSHSNSNNPNEFFVDVM